MGTPVQPLVASRLAMPERSGTFDLSSFLTPKVRATYEDPERLRDWPPGVAPPVPRCGLLSLSAEWLRLLARMDGCGLLDLADVDEVPRGLAGENLAASFFATTKDAEHDRTVVNRVRRNAQERRLGLVGPVFPHGSSLCEIHLRDGEELRISADDLPDYYHTCAISRARALSNAVGRPVPLHVAKGWASWTRFEERYPEAAARARRRGVVQPLWNALPMGDGNAVDYAQVGHCNVLRAGGAMLSEHLIAYRDPWPRGPTAEGVMVDDHVVTQVVPRGASRAAALRRVESGPRSAKFGDETVLQRSSSAYAGARLAPKPSKSVRFAAQVEVWGAHVDGRRGAVRSKLDVHWRALALTLDLLALGRASVEMWRAAVSLWVHVLLFRRCGLALLQNVFQFTDSKGRSHRDSDPRDVLPIHGRAASELLSLIVLSPLFETDLRARWSSELVCTDASSSWGASVAAHVSPDVTAELWRHRDRRGGYVRVGDDWETLRAAASLSSERDQRIVENAARLADSSPVPAPEVDPAVWLEELVAHLPWRQMLRFHMPDGDHINVKEARAYCADVRRVAADPAEHGSRRVVGLDSRVVTGAVAKGRSSSARLNAPLRRVVPHQLCGGLYYGSNFVRTHVNPADDPTRGRRPRGIEGAACPAWLDPLLRGDPSAFDQALPPVRRHQLHKAGLFPPADPRDHSGLKFDATLGYPGEGPPKRVRAARAPLNLRHARVSATERQNRAGAAAEFESFLAERGLESSVHSLPSPEVAGSLLADFGQSLYDAGYARTRYVHAILAVADAQRAWRRNLQEAWDVVGAWELHEPGSNRVPLPQVAFAAGVAVALAWEWYEFANFLILSWASAGRPGEILALTRRALVLPSDLGQTDDVAYVVFEEPKTGRQTQLRHAARRQHARVDAVEAVAWLEAICRGLHESAPMVDLTYAELRAAWQAVFGERLGFSTTHLTGVTPASVRAGAATALYRSRESAEPVRWQLRHTSQRMTERYIQESVAALVLGRLPSASRHTIAQLADAAPALLSEATDRARSGPLRQPRPDAAPRAPRRGARGNHAAE